ncbi:MAG: capsular polysaccharide biosynthesis protein, partial [Kiritimatiellae bacterium]|nr:capsular polysaccharide biosynthesis protein [Kiritimatiellia bacterium]
GMPFYAGWGLTIDKQRNPRRTNTRTLEEVFYIFYVLYTHWVDFETGGPCSIDRAMDNLVALRDEYRREKESERC